MATSALHGTRFDRRFSKSQPKRLAYKSQFNIERSAFSVGPFFTLLASAPESRRPAADSLYPWKASSLVL